MNLPRGRFATGDDATFDEELLKDGLWLSLIGMGVVFTVLSLLAISIKVFDRVDQLLPESGTASPAPQTASTPAPEPSPVVAEQPKIADEEKAAVIGVALALADSESGQSASSPIIASAQSPTNAWLVSGRSRQMLERSLRRSNTARRGS